MDKSRPTTVYMLVELKKPKLKDGKDQLRSYCNATGAPIAVWTNGDQISYYQRKDPNYFEDIPDLPSVNQTPADILQIKFTLEDLISHDKLVKENKSLKTLIEEMEDEVLANAGVDVFEELFKLIFTKLYDEWYSGQGNRRKTRSLEFRNTGQTEADLKTKIQDLFDLAKRKWEGVFSMVQVLAQLDAVRLICTNNKHYQTITLLFWEPIFSIRFTYLFISIASLVNYRLTNTLKARQGKSNCILMKLVNS